jgi:hypothetical protein
MTDIRPEGLSRASRYLAGLVVLANLAGCAAAASPSTSAQPSRTASSVEASTEPTPAAPIPSDTAAPTPTTVPTPESITATSAPFSLLPADPPPDFVSTITCEGDIGPSDPVAIVQLKASDPDTFRRQELRNYADISSPRTVCTFGDGDFYIEDLIDAKHVLIIASGVHAVVDLPEVRYHWFDPPQADGVRGNVLAVSPQLDAVVWSRYRGDRVTRDIVLTTAAGDEVVAALPGVEGGRCGAPEDSNFADYQHAGTHYYVLDQLYLQVNALVVADGAVAKLDIQPPEEGTRDPGTIPTFAMWSPLEDVLYFRLGDDVMRWTPEGGQELFMADTPWFHPSMTADGRYLAYVVDTDLYLVDFEGDATPRLIQPGVLRPVFLNNAQLWFEEASSAGCITEERQVRVYDVRDGSVAPSIVEWVQEVWPGTSSNH